VWYCFRCSIGQEPHIVLENALPGLSKLLTALPCRAAAVQGVALITNYAVIALVFLYKG
jgi:hypothetical protein